MIVILAIDALEYELVEKFNYLNLKQRFYGKTDINEFSQPRTMVLWSSFLTGKNKEEEILEKSSKEMWDIYWPKKDTFLSRFKNPVIFDFPGYNYNLVIHEKSRQDLKKFFEAETDQEKEKIRQEYNKDAFDHHQKIKEKFLNALKSNYDIILGYFSISDVIGHLNFGNNLMMKMIYKDLDEIAGKVLEKESVKLIILSDHGMKAIGEFGNHTDYGFWSTNFKDLKTPEITDFFLLLQNEEFLINQKEELGK